MVHFIKYSYIYIETSKPANSDQLTKYSFSNLRKSSSVNAVVDSSAGFCSGITYRWLRARRINVSVASSLKFTARCIFSSFCTFSLAFDLLRSIRFFACLMSIFCLRRNSSVCAAFPKATSKYEHITNKYIFYLEYILLACVFLSFDILMIRWFCGIKSNAVLLFGCFLLEGNGAFDFDDFPASFSDSSTSCKLRFSNALDILYDFQFKNSLRQTISSCGGILFTK